MKKNLMSTLNRKVILKKTKQLLMICIIGFLAIGCSSDDESEIDTSLLTGEWFGESVEYNGTGPEFDFKGHGYDIDFSITINEALNEAISTGTYSVELTITAQGQVSIVNREDLTFGESSAIQIVDDKILFTSDNTTFKIVRLTDNLLELSTSVSEEGAEINLHVTLTR